MSKCLIAMASSIHLYIKSPSSKGHLIKGTSSFKEFLVGSRKGLKIKMSKIKGVHLKAKIENFNNAFVAKNTCTVLRKENKPLVRLLNSKYLRIGFFFSSSSCLVNLDFNIGSRTLLKRACGRHGNGRSVINKVLEKILYVQK